MSGATPNVVRVHFIDKSCKAFPVDPQMTAAILREKIVERIGLKEDACFALFEKKDDWGKIFLPLPIFKHCINILHNFIVERCLEPEEKPIDLMLQWDKEKAERKKSDSESSFVFKKKIFLKDDDREMEDTVAKDLIYKQVNTNFSYFIVICIKRHFLFFIKGSF